MMTIEQTIDIPVNRELRLVLPLSVSSGRAKITLNITPLDPKNGGGARGSKPAGDAELEKIMREASERAERERVTGYKPFEGLYGCLKGSGIFDGDPVEIQRKMRDEWENPL
jgi:hypothetical protein